MTRYNHNTRGKSNDQKKIVARTKSYKKKSYKATPKKAARVGMVRERAQKISALLQELKVSDEYEYIRIHRWDLEVGKSGPPFVFTIEEAGTLISKNIHQDAEWLFPAQELLDHHFM